jgi:hypothetical protein
MEEKRILIFAGAGASTAVSPENYPTTVEFFNRLPDEVRRDKVLGFIETWYRDHPQESGGPLDIEIVLWALDDLITNLDLLRDAKKFYQYLLRNDVLLRWTEKYQDKPLRRINEVLQHFPRIVPQLRELKTSINSRVYDLYSRAPTHSQLEHTRLPLLEGLLRTDWRVELATTNYDVVLEAALDALKHPRKPATGRPESGIYRYLDLNVWQSPLQPDGLLTKLHGSVDWSRDEEQVLVGAPLFTGQESRHVIIYPGFKGAPESKELALFHNYFAQAIASAEAVVVVGFAFRDAYINQLFQDNLDKGATIFTINPAQGIPGNPFVSDSRHVAVAEPFGVKSVGFVLDTLRQLHRGQLH